MVNTISIAERFAAELEYGNLDELSIVDRVRYNTFYLQHIKGNTWSFVDNYDKGYPVKTCSISCELTNCLDVVIHIH
jgi:hypothetical protein